MKNYKTDHADVNEDENLPLLAGDSSLLRKVIHPKRIGIGLRLGLASNFRICTTLFRTNDPLNK